MRILSLDWGEVRIGGAYSDEEEKFAFTLKKPLDAKTAVSEIKKIVEERKVEKLLIGNPKSLSGEKSLSSQKVLRFIEKLKKEITVPIEMFDERFSTVAASKMLKDQGFSEKKQRQMKDNLVAQIMLQTYLDNQH